MTKTYMPTCNVKTKSSDGLKLEYAGPSSDDKNEAASTVFLGPRAFTDIHAERVRQSRKKGHTREADDALTQGELHGAAVAVLTSSISRWPFEGVMKARDPREACVVAAALLLAEIE